MSTLSEEVMYCSQQINVPLNLPFILKQYAKAAIKTQPKDLLHWSSAYFRALANGDVPPVKDRIEYPLISTPSGLTAGFLRILIKQFGKSGIVEEKELVRRWKGVGLDTNELHNMLKLCGFRLNVRWLNFVAVAAGFLSPNLTQTMILVCELLTDEPEGGSAAIVYKTFMALYIFLARMDCGPICHLKSMTDTLSEEASVEEQSEQQQETESEKSSEKLDEIEIALERKPTIDSNDSADGVMVWEDVAHPDLVQETTSKEIVVTEMADNIPGDVVDEPTTVVDEEEKADDQGSVKSVESYDNTGITLKFHDAEQDVQIDDYTGPIEPKLKKRFALKVEDQEKEQTNEKTEVDESKENEQKDNDNGEEHGEDKRNTEVEINEMGDENKRDTKAEDEIDHKVEEDGHKVEDRKVKEEGDGSKDEGDVKEEGELKKTDRETEEKGGLKETAGEGNKIKKTRKRKKKEKKDVEDGEEEESDQEEQSLYEYSLELEEEEKMIEEESSVREEVVEEEHVEEKVEEEEVKEDEEEEVREEEVKEETTADQDSLDSAILLQGQRKSMIGVGGELHLPINHRNLSFTDSLVSEPDNHYWVHVPGIGQIVPEKQILGLKAYFFCCSERQNGYVMPRNIRHHLCPSLEPPVVELEKSTSTDAEWIKDVRHSDF